MTTVAANGIEIWFDESGDPDDPVLLMICGLGAQSVGYPDELVADLVATGLRVVRYDNRDAGLSTHMGDGASYLIDDMAADGLGLLDALGIERAHLWGCSMGGMIAQQIAIDHPERVASLTSIMSTTGDPDVGGPAPEIIGELLALAGPPLDAEDSLRKGMSMARLIGSVPELFDETEHLRRQQAMVTRGFDPGATGRQFLAIFSSAARSAGLAELDVPALVIHGTADRLIDVSGGRRTAELVSGSRLVELDGMGHDLPRTYRGTYVAETEALVASSSAADRG